MPMAWLTVPQQSSMINLSCFLSRHLLLLSKILYYINFLVVVRNRLIIISIRITYFHSFASYLCGIQTKEKKSLQITTFILIKA